MGLTKIMNWFIFREINSITLSSNYSFLLFLRNIHQKVFILFYFILLQFITKHVKDCGYRWIKFISSYSLLYPISTIKWQISCHNHFYLRPQNVNHKHSKDFVYLTHCAIVQYHWLYDSNSYTGCSGSSVSRWRMASKYPGPTFQNVLRYVQVRISVGIWPVTLFFPLLFSVSFFT